MISILGRIADIFALLAGLILLTIVLVTTTNTGAFILDRIVGMMGGAVSGLPGYEDFVRLAISSAGLMVMPFCQYQRGHVAVDLFMQKAPKAVQNISDRLWLLVTAGVAAFLSYWMVIGMEEKRDDFVITAVLGWPEWPFYIPGIVSVGLWAVIALAQAVFPEGGEDVHS